MRDNLDDLTRRAFAILGVDPGAKPAAARRAFRLLALKHHPDRNPGDSAAVARFRRVNEAYAIVSRHYARPASPPQPPLENPFKRADETPVTTDFKNYPTPEELASLGRPRGFNPLKPLGWACALALLTLLLLSLAREHAHIPPDPPPAHPWVEHFLREMGKRF